MGEQAFGDSMLRHARLMRNHLPHRAYQIREARAQPHSAGVGG